MISGRIVFLRKFGPGKYMNKIFFTLLRISGNSVAHTGPNDPAILGSYGVKGVANASNIPGTRFGMIFVYHPVSDSLILVGGSISYAGSTNYESDVWQYSLSLNQWIWY